MSKRRVVITGLGMVSPLGLDVASSWSAILAGSSGVGPITHFDVSTFSVRFGGSVKGFDVGQYMPAKEARKMDPFVHYGIAAADEALRDAGIEVTADNAERIGVAIGSGIGGLPGIEAGHLDYINGGPRRISPFFVPGNIINMVAGNVSIRFGLKGPNLSVVTACASATHSIGDSARLIEYGDADVMLAGGAEMATSPMGVGGFAAARALSTRNDDPQRASRPWDRDRDGFVLSDGAGILVLEEYEHARRRGATIYAELLGYGMSGDAHHMTQPDASGDGAFRCMRLGLHNAGLDPQDVQYINAHGTSTPAGDLAETVAIRRTFGAHAPALAVSSTKSMTGHLLGAAGGVEAIFTVLALRDQVAPPTINLDVPGEGCDLDYVPHTARPMRIDNALSNSFGFGGTNATLVFGRPR
ncbi:MAG TPA: beta-ketoacyl-[acyl-carrier-protein] synthase II [Gammaproteobacteria bacterium]|uniref:beta-ketoacyl-ACP synthase II n=1 Tax=Immundisolibacter sp. TaxID=1934948 RepID=UPI000E844C12|nr:beta-ketoacyl-[acyl-carrier-protein] synthase II [Gammaproteobacteria bacterium]HCZ48844.1 beta-ketoacyl-[acyl-carrier-protein] synthase II [Gammaproteobacteria bacterium]MCH78282.1 beta-ketoacyl-[acyl-carrier-protein] synthase II [Gammaproteobacteria bacterium]